MCLGVCIHWGLADVVGKTGLFQAAHYCPSAKHPSATGPSGKVLGLEIFP